MGINHTCGIEMLDCILCVLYSIRLIDCVLVLFLHSVRRGEERWLMGEDDEHGLMV